MKKEVIRNKIAPYLGNVLRAERKKLKKTQAEIAKAIGVSQQSVGFYEKAINAPSDKTLAAYAELFDLDLEYLLTLKVASVTNDAGFLSNEVGKNSSDLPSEIYVREKVEPSYLAEIEIDGEPLTDAEIEKAKEFIRALRIMQKNK